jgi:hypothetical protein
MHDSSGHTCVYGGGAFMEHLGTGVVDVTDPSKPVQTADLTTSAMQNPGEGLRVHEGRGLLISAHYITGDPRIGTQKIDPSGSPSIAPYTPEYNGFDVYDVKKDCRHPQLLATTNAIPFSTAGLPARAGTSPWPDPDYVYGHEGAFAPDGLTYYVSDTPHQVYHAIDVSDPTQPKLLASFHFPYLSSDPKAPGAGVHGLSVGLDGNRIYVTETGQTGAPRVVPQTGEYHDGFVIVDTSDIQARKPNAAMRFVSETVFRDSSGQQLALQVKIKGKPYVIALGEIGSALGAAAQKTACAAGLTPFSRVKIFDISEEQYPVHVNDLTLEVNDPKNCAAIGPDLDLKRSIPLTYDVHHCSVDNREEATTLACGYFESGIRVYDIRDPAHVKEIAYFNPAATTSARPGTGWCASMAIVDAPKGMVYSWCQETGVLALKFTNGVWPVPGATTPKDRQL